VKRGRDNAQKLPLGPKRGGREITSSEAFGMWKDRPNLRSVSRYARELRRARFRDL
jgi:hypothetical protein